MTEFLALLLPYVGLAGLFFGLYRYWWEQRWKRAEFVAAEVRRFEELREVRNACAILDYTIRRIDFGPCEDGARFVTVDREMMRAAIAPHSEGSVFGREQMRVRDTFEIFFNELGRFQVFVDTGLFEHRHLKPYLDYWVGILAGANQRVIETRDVRALWRFLRFYGYEDVRRLCEGFGHDVDRFWEEER